jgi:hypothetical protein
MKGGNSAAVAAGRVDRRRIRDRVDGGDKEDQTDQPDGIFMFQNVLEQVEAIPLASTPHFMRIMILHSLCKYREIYYKPIDWRFRPLVTLLGNE